MKKLLVSGVLLAGALTMAAAPAAAQQINWVYANGYAQNLTQTGVLADVFIKKVEAATGGKLKIRQVAGGALLKPTNMVQGVGGKVANMGASVVSFFPGQLPISATLGGLVDPNYGNKLDLAGITKVTNELLADVPELSAEYEKQGVKVLFFVPSPAYAIISKAPITNLAGFKGKKIRTLGNVLPKLLKAAGAVPLAVNFGEIYTSIQTGVLDGAMTDPPAMLIGKFQEVAKNVITTGPEQGAITAIAPVAYFVNLDDWKSLKPDMQKAILKVAKEMPDIAAAKMEKVSKSTMATLKADGVTIHHLTQQETDKLAHEAPNFLKLAAQQGRPAGRQDHRPLQVPCRRLYRQQEVDAISLGRIAARAAVRPSTISTQEPVHVAPFAIPLEIDRRRIDDRSRRPARHRGHGHGRRLQAVLHRTPDSGRL